MLFFVCVFRTVKKEVLEDAHKNLQRRYRSFWCMLVKLFKVQLNSHFGSRVPWILTAEAQKQIHFIQHGIFDLQGLFVNIIPAGLPYQIQQGLAVMSNDQITFIAQKLANLTLEKIQLRLQVAIAKNVPAGILLREMRI